MSEPIRYVIDDRVFYQRKLTNLQQTLVEEMIFDQLQHSQVVIANDVSLFMALGPLRVRLMGICLIPEDMTVREFIQNLQRPTFLQEQEEFFDFQSDPGTRYKVIADFFVCNQIGLYIDSIASLRATLSLMSEDKDNLHENGSKNSAPCSQEGTQQAENLSTA